MTFSAHKAYAPFGSGAIVGKKDYLNEEDPFLSGGGCVAGVFDERLIWTAVPEKYEAGTQNFFGAIAMAKALSDLKNIGFQNIEMHEKLLKDYIINSMKSIKNVIMYGDVDYTDDRIGVIPFNIKNRDYSEVSIKMATENAISLRAGKFCAHTYVYRLLGVSDSDAYRDVISGEYFYGMIRASLGLYNTKDEADIFLNELDQISNSRNSRRVRKHIGRIRF